jgi:hypothetical protein
MQRLFAFPVISPISPIGHARARDYQHRELNSWYESLHSGKGPPAAMATMRSALMASGLMFRATLSWMDRTALAARWSGLTT